MQGPTGIPQMGEERDWTVCVCTSVRVVWYQTVVRLMHVG
jgi:hypothetical protein